MTRRSPRPILPLFSAALLGCGLAIFASLPASALSELPEEQVKPAPEVEMVPLPDPLPNPSNSPAMQEPTEAEPGEQDAAPDSNEPSDSAEPEGADEDLPVPPISYDISALPEAVRTTRERILAAAKAGDIEQLRPLIATGDSNATQFSLTTMDGDPIAFLKSMSGDDQGHEILAILSEVLEAGYVHTDIGTENEIYLWPYFFSVPIDSLTPAQRVELFRLVTAGDYEDMKNFGAYIFYRTGIRPDGSWAFFVAGD